MVIVMAKKARFIGSVQHTPDTIELLYKTSYYTYDTLRILIRILIGAAAVFVGLAVEMPRAFQALLLLAGCWLIISRDFPAAARADKALDARKADLPVHTCTFFDNAVELSGEGSMRLDYKQFQRLIEDDGYLYLFLGRQSVCMVDKNSVEGGNTEELKRFTAQRTGLSWQRNRSLLTMNLADLRQALRDRKIR